MHGGRGYIIQSQYDHGFADYERRLRNVESNVRAYCKATWALLDRARNQIEIDSLHGYADDELGALMKAAIADEFARVRLHLARQYDELLQSLSLSRFATAADWIAKRQPHIPSEPIPIILAGIGEGTQAVPNGYVRQVYSLCNTYTRPERTLKSNTDFRSLIVISGGNEDLLAGLRMASARLAG